MSDQLDVSEPSRPTVLLGSDKSSPAAADQRVGSSVDVPSAVAPPVEQRVVLTRRGRLLADAVVRTLLP